MADASIRSKSELHDYPHTNTDHHNADNYHHSDRSVGAHGARHHPKKANEVCA